MIFLFVLALVVFGPKRLPELGKKLGKGMSEFRRASSELKSTFQREMDNIERETQMQEVRKAAADVNRQLTTSYNDVEDDYYDAYDYSSSRKKNSAAATDSDSSSSTGGSTDSAPKGAETTSSDGSQNDAPEASSGDASESEPQKHPV